MAISIALWSQEVKPKETVVIQAVADLRITNVALGETLADASGRTTVKLVYQAAKASEDSDDEEGSDAEGESDAVATILCSLTPGKIESATIDIVLNEGEEYIIETVGKNVIHLTGNYIDQNPLPAGPDDYSDMSSEDGYDLQDVSSDVEINPEDLEMDGESDASRFEEVNDDAPKSAKRALEEDEPVSGVSKAEKKKNKKQKAANGEAVPTGEEEKPKSKKEKKEKADKEPAKPSAAEKELPGGLKIKDAKVGSGQAAKKGKRVEMRYIGKLTSGKIFDSNTKGKPFAFRLGGGEVIKGWDEGIVGMQVGGERVLTVPASMAYGKKGVSGIPPNSTLIFEVKLLTVK